MAATTRFEATVRQQGDVAVVDLAGDVNIEADGRLAEAYAEAVADGAARILLNFAQVEYINSTGIALIVGVLARARKDHRTLIACGLSDHYRKIFEITRLADFMTIVADEDSAGDPGGS